MDLILYAGLGAFAGILAGLLGVGGGLVIVPVLLMIFEAAGHASDRLIHLAVGTSLATIVFTSISSVLAHHSRGSVRWDVFWRMTPGIVIGALLGSALADRMPGTELRTVFGLFELAVAAQMAFGGRPSPHRQLPNRFGLAGVGSVIGAVSAIVGIGGGTMTVPFLAWCNVAMHKAVGTSAACGLPIAVAGATGFMLTGWEDPGLPQPALGYVYLPALFGIVAASMLFAPLGARMAHAIPAASLKRIFAVFLAFLGIRMLIG